MENFLKDKEYGELQENAAYKKTLEKFLKRARRRSVKDYANLTANFSVAVETARENGVLLCIENREHIGALPLECNFRELMEGFSEVPEVRAWHDVGHSMIKQLSGVCTQEAFAEEILPYQAGWHLHDCTAAGKDHVAIGDGIVDFKRLSKFFNPEKHIFTLELNHAVERKAAADSLKRIQDLMP